MTKLRIRLFHWWFLLSRPMTLGVRIIVPDNAGRVLLVKHTYVPGWHLPGGGVDRGETTLQAAVRELSEEACLRPVGDLKLTSVHANREASRRDHVLVYVCDRYEMEKPFEPNREISETGFFASHELPRDTARGTRARLTEFWEGVPASPYW